MDLEILQTTIKGVVKDILLNKIRAFLTIFGIVIGIASVTIMVSVGESAQKLITGSITQIIEKDTLIITPGAGDNSMFGPSPFSSGLSFSDYLYLKEFEKKEFKLVSGRTIGTAKIKYNETEVVSPLYITDTEFFGIIEYKFLKGSEFTKNINGDNSINREAVINKSLSDKLFGLSSPIGKEIVINDKDYIVIGVVKDTGGGLGISGTNEAFILFEGARSTISFVFVKAYNSGESRTQAQNLATALLMVNRQIKSVNDIDFTISTQDDIVATSELITGTVTNFIAVISSISLIVGGIGIMNIILASVKERVKEFGLRKAIGARDSDIVVQVLTESFIYSFIGGVGGSLLGIVVSFTIQEIAGLPNLISSNALIVSMLVSSIVGLICGIYPALTARKLSPIEALRSE